MTTSHIVTALDTVTTPRLVTTPRIDAHQHFWTIARGDYGWLTPSLDALYRDVEPAELRPLLARHAIDGTILVQAAPTDAETHFLLALADANPFVMGVVGWADLAAPDAAATIDALARHPKLRGLRPMLHDLMQDDWVDVAPITAALEVMTTLGLVFDALVRPANLRSLLSRIGRHPGLSVVIDHAAKPLLRESPTSAAFSEWKHAMAALARHPNVHCKLSGLLTEAPAGADATRLRPWFDVLLEAFGPAKLIWGSDWPVLTMVAGYDEWLSITDGLLRDTSVEDRNGIMGGNAMKTYRLDKDAST